MSWKCRFIHQPPLREEGSVDWSKLAVGDMWFYELPAERWEKAHLTKHYWENHSQRRGPLVVLLPGPNWFLIDGQCYSTERGYYDGWKVTGKAPLITVTPSIHIQGRYHGHLKNGVISDDVDERKFDAEGKRR
jgi:hypothetical protein